jgi:hypothetical protein
MLRGGVSGVPRIPAFPVEPTGVAAAFKDAPFRLPWHPVSPPLPVLSHVRFVARFSCHSLPSHALARRQGTRGTVEYCYCCFRRQCMFWSLPVTHMNTYPGSVRSHRAPRTTTDPPRATCLHPVYTRFARVTTTSYPLPKRAPRRHKPTCYWFNALNILPPQLSRRNRD